MKKYIINFQKIKSAASDLSQKTEKERNSFLKNLSNILVMEQEKIIEANKKDVNLAKKSNPPSSFIQRLILSGKEIKSIIDKLKEIEKLKSGTGKTIEEKKQQDGLILRKVSVPLGIIAVIYEARPEVTIDVAALCIKSGNAAILKGGSEASNTNKVLYDCILSALKKSGFKEEAVNFISTRDQTYDLLKQNKYIDLVIARGGYDLVKNVLNNSTIPVLAHSAGGARIYVDKSADLSMAKKIIINAKINKPAACNSADTIIVHKDLVLKFLPDIIAELKLKGVEVLDGEFNDWDIEFLGPKIGIKVVNNVNEAISFINKYTKKHSEGIIASNKEVIELFVNSLDAAAVFVNCSPRLHDGYVFGLGSEMGIATGKLHARGPVGLRELTTYRWEVYGNGQIRK